MRIIIYKFIDGKKYEYGRYNPEQPSELNAMVTAISYISQRDIDVKAETIKED